MYMYVYMYVKKPCHLLILIQPTETYFFLEPSTFDIGMYVEADPRSSELWPTPSHRGPRRQTPRRSDRTAWTLFRLLQSVLSRRSSL